MTMGSMMGGFATLLLIALSVTACIALVVCILVFREMRKNGTSSSVSFFSALAAAAVIGFIVFKITASALAGWDY